MLLDDLDVGLVEGDAIVRRTVPFKNTSSDTWQLDRTWEDCGCISIVECEPRVEPGGEGRLTIEVDAGGQTAGRTQRNVYARFLPDGTVLGIAVTAELIPEPHMAPNPIVVEVADDGSFEGRAELVFRARIHEVLEHRLVASDPSLRTADVTWRQDGELVRGAFGLQGLVPEGETPRRTSLIATISLRGRELELTGQVLRRRTSAWSLSPTHLVLSRNEPTVRGRVHVLAANVRQPELVATLLPQEAGSVRYDAAQSCFLVDLDARREASDAELWVEEEGSERRSLVRLELIE